MHKTKSVQENRKHKILSDFKIQTDPLVPAGRLDLVIVNKKKDRTNRIVDFAVLAHCNENQRKRKEKQVLRPCLRTFKIMKHECDRDTNCNCGILNDPQRIG